MYAPVIGTASLFDPGMFEHAAKAMEIHAKPTFSSYFLSVSEAAGHPWLEEVHLRKGRREKLSPKSDKEMVNPPYC